jgi:hypothetical protein
MNQRIANFEVMWNNRLLRPTLVRFEPEEEEFDPQMFQVFRDIPQLVRQTNRHELLSPENRERWWNANQAERQGIMDEELPEPEELDFDYFPPPPLVRQTNLHELLSPENRERWWNATQA